MTTVYTTDSCRGGSSGPHEERPRLGSWGPVVLWRRGTLPFSRLGVLIPTRTWAALDCIEKSRAARFVQRDQLEQALYDLVPQLMPASRGAILRLRRDVHNERAITHSRLAATLHCLPADILAKLDAWSSALTGEHKLRNEAQSIFEEERAGCRDALGNLAAQEHFLQGIQLSGRPLYDDVVAYCDASTVTRAETRRHRRTERTLASFACRVALKPSPFATFTIIGAHPWSEPTHPGGQPTGGQAGNEVRRARINRGMLDWMVHELARLDGSEHCLVLRLNDTVRLDGDKLTFFARGEAGSDAQFGGERFITMPITRPVRALLDALAQRRPAVAQVIAHLCSKGATPSAAAAFVGKIVQTGLCLRDLGLEDQAGDLCLDIASALAEAPKASSARAAASIFTTLADVEARFADAKVVERCGLLDTISAQVARFTTLCGRDGASVDFARSQVFEDLGSRGPSASWEAHILEANRRAFTAFQEILPLLDDAALERFGLAKWFRGRYGSDATVALLDVYRDFSQLGAAEKSAVMLGVDDPLCTHMRAEREGLLLAIAARVGEHQDEAVVQLDPDWLRERAARLPPEATSGTDVAYRIQICAGPGPGRIVLNGATTGRGVYYSRFCDLLEPNPEDTAEAWSLTAAVREDIALRWQHQTDLVAVLGMNVNLHPRLAPHELLYPGAVAREGDATPSRTLAEVAVRVGDNSAHLELVATTNGSTIELVPLNFLFPAAAPMLYRFLCGFAPTWSYRRGLWDRLSRGRLAGDRRYFPRLVVDDLVLERRTWRVPAVAAAVLSDLNDVDALVASRAWQAQEGLPTESFFRLDTGNLARVDGQDWLALTRAWALEARSARLRKPHYLDLRSPLLVDVLVRQARSMPTATVVFQECLPAPGGDLDNHDSSAEELIVQFRTDGGSL